jgi:DNA-3-methyladenine glycosylase II
MSKNRRESPRSRQRTEEAPSPALPSARWAAAVRHLRRVDPHLRAIIDRIGPCRLEPHPDRFGALVRSIISQQISSKAATSINQRLAAHGGEPHRPRRLIELGEPVLRSAGLSGAKARYVLNLAEAVDSGHVPLDDIDDSWDEPKIIANLTSVKGIGVWTAEMFLIFVLNRPDVLPASDLGIRAAIKDRHGLAELPKPRECFALAEPWRPYRTIASWYFWRRVDTAKALACDAVEEERAAAKRKRKSP